ncbi:MAG: Ig-like domain repeat protein, partial [Bryobacteraceae bacterium]
MRHQAILKTSSFAVALCAFFGAAGHAQTTFNAANGALTFPSCNGNGPPCDVTSTITPTGLSGTISNITVTLNPKVIAQFQETFYILQAPGGKAIVLLGQGCVGDSNNNSFTISDAGTATLQVAQSGTQVDCSTLSGTYKPASNGIGTSLQSFVASYNLPAIDGSSTLLSTFGGLGGVNLTGAWTLYAIEESGDEISGSLGSSSSAAWSLTITTAAATGTSTSVSSNDNPAFTGDAVTFTATVTSTSTVNGGTVTFLDSGTALTCSGGNQTVSNGSATCSLSTLSEGAHSITASYGGSGSFGVSTSPPLLQVVNNHTAATPNPPMYKFCNAGTITIPRTGASGDYSATGAPANPYASEIFASGVSGTIQDVQVLLNGFTSVDPQAVGLLLVGPNSNNLDFFSFAGGSSSVSGLNVTIDDLASGQIPNGSISSASYKPTSITSGDATVYCSNSAGCNNVIVSEPAPSTFTSAGPHGAGTLMGQFGGISPNGTWQLFAVDRIGGETASIGSWCLNFTVSSGDATSTSVTSSLNPSYTTSPNNSVTFTATVTDTAHSGTIVGAGTVTFADGGTNLTCTGGNPATVSAGTATCATSFTTEGNHSISASYSGTTNFAESNATPLTQIVYNHTTVSLNSGVYSYCNAGPFDIPAGGPNHNAGPSGPYPEDIFVSSLPGTINIVSVSLNDYASNDPGQIDMMLVGPCQTNACTPTVANGIDFFSRVGGTTPVSGLNFVIADSAGASLSNTDLVGGTFKTTSELGTSTYGAPAPQGTYQYAAPNGGATFGTVFSSGQNGNGTWSLYGESTLEGAYVTLTGSPAFCVNITPNAPVLAITKTNNPTDFRQGDTGDTFAITVMNNGPGATGDPTATNPVTVVDTLPVSGLTATAISGTGWNCTLSSLTCTRSDALAATDSYDTITVTVNVAANATASVTNSAAVSGGGSSGTKTASDVVTVVQVADLTIAKSHTGPFVQGDTAAANDTYTITVSNASGKGPTVGTVTVADTLPTGLTASSMSGMGWTCTVGTLTCTRSDVLASGSSYSAISLVVTVASNAATGTNSVTVSGGGELNTANDTATDPTTITPLPDLTISKSHMGNFTQGQVGATYTIVVGNAANAANTTGTVTMTDTLPAGLTATNIAGMGWTCSTMPLMCSRSDALAGGSNYPAITVTVTVASNAMSSVTNMAAVSGGGELNTSNDTANDMTTVIQVPDLTIAKSHSTQFVQGDIGDKYSIVVSNAGPGPVVAGNTVTVVDTLPSGLTATAISGSGWLCVTGTLTCTTTNALALNGMYQPITVTVNVSSTAPASVTNMAAVSGGGELNTANDTASDVTSITQVADLTISKSHTGNFYQGQQGVTYTITVNNVGSGPTDGSQVLVSDTLPAGLTFVSMSGSGWTCPGVGQPQFRQTVSVTRTGRRAEVETTSSRTPEPRISSAHTCSRTDVLAINSSYPPITLTANVDNNAGSSVTNNVAVSGGGEINTSNDTASDPTTITPGPDLTIAKTHTGNFMQGQTGATYSIVVTNSGGSPSVGMVTVADTLPSGLTATGISGMGWSCTTSPLACTRSDALATSSSYPAIALTVNVSTSAASPQNNTATVSGGGDVNTNNNSSTDTTTIVPGSDMTITKSHTGTFLQGQTGATYTITASNSGIGPTVGIVTVSDMLPTGLTATAMTGTGWNCTLGTLSCTRSDILGQGYSYPPITLTVSVAANAPSSVTNMATVAGGGESNTSNDTASDITNIIPPADLTISKSHTGNF